MMLFLNPSDNRGHCDGPPFGRKVTGRGWQISGPGASCQDLQGQERGTSLGEGEDKDRVKNFLGSDIAHSHPKPVASLCLSCSPNPTPSSKSQHTLPAARPQCHYQHYGGAQGSAPICRTSVNDTDRCTCLAFSLWIHQAEFRTSGCVIHRAYPSIFKSWQAPDHSFLCERVLGAAVTAP